VNNPHDFISMDEYDDVHDRFREACYQLKLDCIDLGGDYHDHSSTCTIKERGNKIEVGCYELDLESQSGKEASKLIDAAHALVFSASTWTNPLDTEYYSADGYDDHMAEQRSGAYDHAVEQIVKVLKGSSLGDDVFDKFNE
jgi:hypothetical protein